MTTKTQVCLLALAALAACSSGSSAPSGTGTGLSVSPASLSFTAVRTGAATTAQVVTVTVTATDAARVVVGAPAGAAIPSWLRPVLNAAATPPTVTVTASPGFLPTGTQTAAFRVSIVRADDSIIGYVDVPVSFTLTPVAPEATPQTLTFTQPIGGAAPAAQTVTLDAFVDTYAWTATVEYPGASGWLRLNGAPSASGAALPASLSVSVASASSLAEGTYAAQIRVSGVGGEVLIPVSLVVRLPRLLLAGGTYTALAAVAGQATAPSVSINVGAEGASMPYTVGVAYGAGASGWLAAPASGTAPEAIVVRTNTTDLPGGTYTATVTLTPANGTPALVMTVSYNVRIAKLTTNPAWISVGVDAATVLAGLTRTLSIASDSLPLGWSVASAPSWVTLSQTSGTTPSTVTVSVDQAALDSALGGRLDGVIALSYSGPRIPAGTELPLSVAVQVYLPRIDRVTPYVAYEGAVTPVLLRGGTYASTSTYDLSIGGVAPIPSSYVDTSALRATAPGTLTPGRHAVRLADNPNALGLNPSTAELLVLPVTPHTTGLVAKAGTRTRLVYDPERRCLYAVAPSAGELQRFCDGPAGWVVDSLAIAGIKDLALLPDGSQLLVTSGGALHYVDAASLTAVSTRAASDLGISSSIDAITITSSWEAILLVNSWDHRIWYYRLGAASAEIDWYTTLNTDSAAPCIASSLDAGLWASGDRVAPYGTYKLRIFGGIHRGLFTATVTADVVNVSLDRSGTRIAAGGIVYDDSGIVLGDLRTKAATLSPDGTRAYAIEDSGSYYDSNSYLHAWDVSGASIVELGTGTVLTPSPGVSTWNPENLLVMSHDGRTLFVDGYDGIAVVAVP
jgi:hypothetical protein